MDRRKRLESNEISKSPSFGCWDYCSITEFRDGRYIPLDPIIAVEHIKINMDTPIKIFKDLSDKNRTFKARKIDKNKNSKNRLYDSIKNDLL